MRTIDIAIQHLSEHLDVLKTIDIYNYSEGGYPNEIFQIKEEFDSDSRNTISNDYFRSVCFEIALYHLLDRINGRHPTCFEEACGIVGEYRLFSWFREKWNNTIYPKVMMDNFDSYCQGIGDKKPFYLQDKNEMRPEILMCAYHYVTN